MIRLLSTAIALIVLSALGFRTAAVEPTERELGRQFRDTVQPLLKKYCHECHDKERAEAKLVLSAFPTLDAVIGAHQTWDHIRERLEAGEMPPEDAPQQPSNEQRAAIVKWVRAVREHASQANAGDPGVVPARRLNSAEYNYTIRDLTGVDIRPAREFPVDPANEAGFDNSADSLAMTPALAKKYLDAARFVADHLVLTPQGIAFASNPVATDTDRDKYCVRRIIDFYQQQPTDLADYFLAAWRFEHRALLGQPDATLHDIAAAQHVSSKYLATIYSALKEQAEVGPMARLQAMWRELPPSRENETDAARDGCQAMRDWIQHLRRTLEPKVANLKSPGVHDGSQCFVLWKNRQYAANRRTYDRGALDAPEMAVPADPDERARFEASFARFASVFPDAFYISERGRDYVGKPREQQEKGRLLSAGFHSQMGYFRDDGPLYEMVLEERQQAHLDTLWQELDFVANVPLRQLQGFLWFERTDSRFMRDPQFDFARAEDKDAGDEWKITQLADVYSAKARANGGGEVALEAIRHYFHEINARIRWVQQARVKAEPRHLDALLEFAEQAYRRPLTRNEHDDLVTFYRSLRSNDELTHEEAVQDTLVAILMSPLFCYRLDLVTRAGDTRRNMTDYELASRLSYFLWSSMPDAKLLGHAAAGDLHRPEVLVAEARRMLHDDRVRALGLEFGGNWLDFRRFEAHNAVDRNRFPTFTNELRQAMFEEPVRFFIDLVQHDGSVLEFLYGTHTFVNGVLADHYDLPGRGLGPNEWMRMDDAAEKGRGGLLPMAVFLTQNAPGLRTSPVKRGYWVVRRLLGERIPPPPPGVPELPADEAKLELTLRETLARHREHASCAACHERFDSLGLVFEGYGPIGERRGHDLAGRPVETATVFPGGGEGQGLDGLRNYLRDCRQEEFLENLCRKLVSYGLGRTLLPSDDRLVEDMRRRLAAEENRFGALVETIVTSPQFLTKRGYEAPVKDLNP
jgi:mono/diheme cytochrome c family protein